MLMILSFGFLFGSFVSATNLHEQTGFHYLYRKINDCAWTTPRDLHQDEKREQQMKTRKKRKKINKSRPESQSDKWFSVVEQ